MFDFRKVNDLFNFLLDFLFKFLIIGNANSGKSCILHQFIESKCKFVHHESRSFYMFFINDYVTSYFLILITDRFIIIIIIIIIITITIIIIYFIKLHHGFYPPINNLESN